MKVIRTRQELIQWRTSLPSNVQVAFVPTMGYLHEGHLSLLRTARQTCPNGVVVLSIFVNPSQFNNPNDLLNYPRDEQGDLAKAQRCGVDVAFCPQDSEEVFMNDHQTWVEVAQLDRNLCGATRPGHFRGVCTVVLKLWELIQPDFAFLGQKDIQQLIILRKMHADLYLRGQIVAIPTVRESDGLAMSSRNARLTPQQRQQAVAIPQFLAEVKRRFDQGVRDVHQLIANAETLLQPGKIDYVEIVECKTLQKVATLQDPAICAVAVYVGDVRLIDHVLLETA